MIRIVSAVLLALIAWPAQAQLSLGPQTIDMTPYALQSAVPLPATSAPPAVADTGVTGSDTRYALANHTHASKARKARLLSAADGTLTYTYETAFASGVVPRCTAIAETGVGVTDVVNVQIEGTPTNTAAVFRVNRTQRSVVALIGLTVLSIPASVGATWVHITCLEP